MQFGFAALFLFQKAGQILNSMSFLARIVLGLL
jgi:hypothetical protein